MTHEELIRELRNSKGWPNLGNAAADRIEQLLESIKGLSQAWATAAVEREVSEGKLDKAVDILKRITFTADSNDHDGWYDALNEARHLVAAQEKTG